MAGSLLQRACASVRIWLMRPRAEGVLVGEPLRAEEIQEDRARLRVPTRALSRSRHRDRGGNASS